MSAVRDLQEQRRRRAWVPVGSGRRVTGWAQGSVVDFFDKLTTVVTPDDIRTQLDSLKASFDVANQKAKGQADWDVYYAEFIAYYNQTRPAIGWLSSGQGTVDQLKQRERELGEWQKRLNQRGIDAGPTRKPEAPASKGPEQYEGLVKLAVAAAALYAGAKLIGGLRGQ